MKNKKIILAGGSGFIGQEITKYFSKENEVIILGRQLKSSRNNRNKFELLQEEDLKNVQFIKWDGRSPGEWVHELENADLLINLAGKTVNCRYTEKNKHEIIDSRVNAVTALGHVIKQVKHPPKLWINASSATIYRHALDHEQDEYNGEFHDGFSVNVCKRWESVFYAQETPATRKVALRMAITLGAGGVLIPYFNLLKFGLGGKQGSGRQMFSWIHITDTCRMIEWIMENSHITGTYNCCAPNPVTNAELMRTLRTVTGKRIGLPAPEWMLKLGAMMIGTETELVLKSRWVVPTRIVETGFKFEFPHLRQALDDIIRLVPRKQYNLF